LWSTKETGSPRSQNDSHPMPFRTQPQSHSFEGTDHIHETAGAGTCTHQSNNEQSPHSSASMHDRLLQPCSSPDIRLQHQSSADFGKDLLRNSHDTVNENIFAEWCWGSATRTAIDPTHEDPVEWDSDSLGPSAQTQVTKQTQRGPKTQTLQYRSESIKPGTGALALQREHSGSWPVLRTRTISADFQTHRGITLELGSALHGRRQFSTVGSRREKLTGEQKRRNHIIHEQKRRAMIKEGFDDLLNLVPDVNNRGLSKSAILFKAAEWLSTLTYGNKALLAQVNMLEGNDTPSSGKPSSRQEKSHRQPNRRC
jgi:hypothetical protein